MSHAVTSINAREAINWLAPPKRTHRYCHHPVMTRIIPRTLATKVPTWGFLKMGLTSLNSSEVATLMNRMTSCMMVTARTTIITLP